MSIIVSIERPVLTPEERAKRMKDIKKATVKLVLAAAKERTHKNG